MLRRFLKWLLSFVETPRISDNPANDALHCSVNCYGVANRNRCDICPYKDQPFPLSFKE